MSTVTALQQKTDKHIFVKKIRVKYAIKSCNSRIKREQQCKELKEQLTKLGQEYFTVRRFIL